MKEDTSPLTEPPEGVVAGENVPMDSEEDEYDRALIEEVMNLMKTRGKPYTTMNDTELEERAVEKIRESGGEL